MKVPPRTLREGQTCQIWVYDTNTEQHSLVFETRDLLLEAPNWHHNGDELLLNGAGVLWSLDLTSNQLREINIGNLPPINNDHVLDPNGTHIYLSTYDDWHIYRAPIAGGEAVRITGQDGPEGMLHFLHGVSPDGNELAFVGVLAEISDNRMKFISAEICSMSTNGDNFKQITAASVPADGPEYDPNGEWIYLNTEAFTGHAQIARMRPDGSEKERLSFSQTVDWFPHIAPNNEQAVYLSYPPATQGHPEDLWVELKLVQNGDWAAPKTICKLFGGQGTINVNSWSPDSTKFAYVAYPLD